MYYAVEVNPQVFTTITTTALFISYSIPLLLSLSPSLPLPSQFSFSLHSSRLRLVCRRSPCPPLVHVTAPKRHLSNGSPEVISSPSLHLLLFSIFPLALCLFLLLPLLSLFIFSRPQFSVISLIPLFFLLPWRCLFGWVDEVVSAALGKYGSSSHQVYGAR